MTRKSFVCRRSRSSRCCLIFGVNGDHVRKMMLHWLEYFVNGRVITMLRIVVVGINRRFRPELFVQYLNGAKIPPCRLIIPLEFVNQY